MFTPAELAAEHARAMRIVKAVLAACDARAATARAARAEGFKEGDAPWVVAIGKAAIGMAEGMKDVCGEPRRHLIVTVDGPAAGSLANIIRSDHPLPTQRSLDAGQAVKRFIEEAKAAGAPSLTVLMSGGASSLICEPIPGLELKEYREVVRAMLEGGWEIQRMNTVRRAIDGLKGGELASYAQPLPIDLFAISDVLGDALSDIGSGPFVQAIGAADEAAQLLERSFGRDCFPGTKRAIACRPHPPSVTNVRRAVVVMNNQSAIGAAAGVLVSEGITVVEQVGGLAESAEKVACRVSDRCTQLRPMEAVVMGGEWPARSSDGGYGGRCQAAAVYLYDDTLPKTDDEICVVALASDGVDGTSPSGRPPAAGVFLYSGIQIAYYRKHWIKGAGVVYWQALLKFLIDDSALFEWAISNSYRVFAHHDAHRRPGEPPAHIFTGPTGTNVNDLLIAWRMK